MSERICSKCGQKIEYGQVWAFDSPGSSPATYHANSEDCQPNEVREARKLLIGALKAFSGERRAYGPPHVNFQQIADYWMLYMKHLGFEVTLRPHDVAIMMDFVKTSRLITTPTHEDSWLDKGGYAAVGWQCVVDTLMKGGPHDN